MRLDLLCNTYKRFKGTGGLWRARSTAGAGRKCEARWGNPWGRISSQQFSFRVKWETRESWRTVAVTPAACPAPAEPQRLFTRPSGGGTRAAAAPRQHGRPPGFWVPSCRCCSELPHVRTLQCHQEPRLDCSSRNARRKRDRRRAGRVVGRGGDRASRTGEPLDPRVVFGLVSRLEAPLMASLQIMHTNVANVPPSAAPLLEETRPPSVGQGTLLVLPHGCVVPCRCSRNAASAEQSSNQLRKPPN